MKDALLGAWLLGAGYSWLARTAFEVDALSAWNWGPILCFFALLYIGAGHEENEGAKKVAN